MHLSTQTELRTHPLGLEAQIEHVQVEAEDNGGEVDEGGRQDGSGEDDHHRYYRQGTRNYDAFELRAPEQWGREVGLRFDEAKAGSE